MRAGELGFFRLTQAAIANRLQGMAEPRIVTFTTDFGLQDPFVGIMHGVVLNIHAETRIVDICHEVPSFNVLDGAWSIAQSYRYFPPRSVHVVVVDPGVGSQRRPILAETDDYIFVAPDNGVLSLVEKREPRFTVRHITAERYFLQPVSQTFHGRDIFSPVAGWLSKGIAPEDFGPEITDYVRLPLAPVQRVELNRLCASVLKVDKFGNLITNLAEVDLPELFSAAAPASEAAGRRTGGHARVPLVRGRRRRGVLRDYRQLGVPGDRGAAGIGGGEAMRWRGRTGQRDPGRNVGLRILGPHPRVAFHLARPFRKRSSSRRSRQVKPKNSRKPMLCILMPV